MARTVPSRNGAKAFEDTSWGIPHQEEIEIDDPDLPDELTEWGRLVEIHLKKPQPNPRKAPVVSSIELTPSERRDSFLAFDPDHQNGRLYLVLTPKLQQQMQKEFWRENPLRPRPLGELAEEVGGRHGEDHDYPELQVKPVGIITAVMYGRNKKGDDYSWYIHKMGEESGIQPVLAVGNDGRLWVAGGNYQSLIAGITD